MFGKGKHIFRRDTPRIIISNDGKDLFIYAVDYSDAGYYFCRVNSAAGVVDSRAATITGTHNLMAIQFIIILCME